MTRPEPLDPFIHAGKAARSVVENLFLQRLDTLIDAYSRLGSMAERPTNSLRDVRNDLADHFAHRQHDTNGQQQDPQK